jgi:large conductance mechanosensitive channel
MNPLRHVTALDPRAKASSLFQEFKNFAFKGNVIDMAVGVIIGAAFAKIISSLVENIFMPLLSLLLPGPGYQDWVFEVGGKKVPYGKFLGDVVFFLIVALALFLFVVKFLGWVLREKKKEEAAPPPPTRDQELLAEIRDLLRKNGQPVTPENAPAARPADVAGAPP